MAIVDRMNVQAKLLISLLLLSSTGAVADSNCIRIHQAGYPAVGSLAAGSDAQRMQATLTSLQQALKDVGARCLSKPDLAQLSATLIRLQQTVAEFAQAQNLKAEALRASEAILSETPQLGMQIETLARNAITQKQSASQLFLITRLLWLSERIEKSVLRMSLETMTIPVLVDSLRRHMMMIQRTLEGLRDGNSELEIAKLSSSEDQAMLSELLAIMVRLNAAMERIAKSADAMEEVAEHSSTLRLESERLASLLSRK